MAEHPELWTERTPERYSFGLARAAERMPVEVTPAPEPPEPRRPRRERGPFITYLCLPWSYGDRPPAYRWHRMRCWLGRHEMQGGHTMQVGGDLVFVERRCRWCTAEARAMSPSGA